MIDLASLLRSPAGVVWRMRLGVLVVVVVLRGGGLGLVVGPVVLVVAAILLVHLR